MTGNEFIQHIRKKGSFVRPEDMESLISFYEAKLLTATTADEEQKILASFGDPDDVIRRIKAEYEKLQLNTDCPPDPAPLGTEGESNAEEAGQSEEDEDVKIFANAPKAPEAEIPPAEEAQTQAPVISRPKAKTNVPKRAKRVQKEEKETSEEKSTPKKLEHPGITNAILDKMKLQGKGRTAMKVVLSVLFSPVFILLGLLLLSLFLLALAGIAAVVVVLCLVEAALIVASVVELIYGILALFSSIPVALIELGLGTVLISFAVAVTALVYQMLTGVIPAAAKYVNRLRKIAFQIFFEIFFGTKGGKA